MTIAMGSASSRPLKQAQASPVWSVNTDFVTVAGIVMVSRPLRTSWPGWKACRIRACIFAGRHAMFGARHAYVGLVVDARSTVGMSARAPNVAGLTRLESGAPPDTPAE